MLNRGNRKIDIPGATSLICDISNPEQTATSLEPVVLSVTDYIGFPNNLQESCDRLMQAYSWNGNVAKVFEVKNLSFNKVFKGSV